MIIEAGSENHFKMSKSSRNKLGGKFLGEKLGLRLVKTKISDEEKNQAQKIFGVFQLYLRLFFVLIMPLLWALRNTLYCVISKNSSGI